MTESALDMNNKAATLIENDQYEDALEILSQALSVVKAKVEDGDGDNIEADPEEEFQATYANDQSIRDETMKRRMIKLDKLSCKEDFIYWHPMKADNIPEAAGNQFVSVLLVFNMALCHHLTALEKDCEEHEARLQGALTLYELGFQMHMKGNIFMEMTYALAMVNNCAQIYKLMKQPRRAKRFMNHMLSSLMIMIECGEATSLDELDGFLQNASNLILKKTVAEAA